MNDLCTCAARHQLARNDYLRVMDAKIRARAAELTELNNADEICVWFAAQDRPVADRHDAYPSAFGALQALTSELLAMLDRADRATADA